MEKDARREDVRKLLQQKVEETEKLVEKEMTLTKTVSRPVKDLSAFEEALLCHLDKKEDEVTLFLASLEDPLRKLPLSRFRKFQLQVLQLVTTFEEPEEKKEDQSKPFQLSSEMLREVDTALSMDPNSQCVVINDYSIRGRDLHTLKEEGWLNDTIRNSYFSLIATRGNGKLMDSFFFTKLDSPVSDQKKRDSALLQYPYLVVPVFRPKHWATMFVCVESRSISYMDSMGGLFKEGQARLRKYLSDQTESNDWKMQTEENPNQPKQLNSDDCGVFACMFANLRAAGKPLSTFSQADITHIRKRMVYEICHGQLLSLP
ncbi:Sentrin-specific protease 1 [Frankliniella fusca]|uniref:Sentrin-specific protease 1 n=1 Tax=Frankliniella fusca TaxID=407009 RepID=A0AAE1H4D9_9NEOP|nr:Sentrin-specific protease 1 [Frankliniella fusca]